MPIGFGTKHYHGPGASVVNGSLGGALYVTFWCLVGGVIFPQTRPIKIVLIALSGTCLVEFSQLLHPPWLETIRSYFIGRTLLGSTFDWFDFPWYFAGAVLGWIWLRALRK